MPWRWVDVPGGEPRSKQLVEVGTGRVLGVLCYLPLLCVWTGRLVLPGHETRSCTRAAQHQARAWIVANARQHLAPRP